MTALGHVDVYWCARCGGLSSESVLDVKLSWTQAISSSSDRKNISCNAQEITIYQGHGLRVEKLPNHKWEIISEFPKPLNLAEILHRCSS